jgi:FtsZ-interacting cell division protein ZipA
MEPNDINVTPVQQSNAGIVSNIKTFLSNKRNLAIISIVVIGLLYFAYKKKYFKFLSKKKEETTETNKTDTNEDNMLDVNKEYNIIDENNAPMKINIKEMMAFHKQIIQEHQQAQQQIQQMQQKMQEIHHHQQMKEQMKQHTNISDEKPQQKKLKHPKKKVVVEESEEDLSVNGLDNDDIEQLKLELAELEKQNVLM